MRLSKPFRCALGILSCVSFAMCVRAQQPAEQSGTATEQKQTYEVSPLPKTFRITDEDLKVALAVSRELAAGNNEQIKKLLAENHVSIPQFQRTVQVTCALSAERELNQAAKRPSGQAGRSSTSATIQNLQEVQGQLKNTIDSLFGGRGSNYANAKEVIDRQPATANQICTSIVKAPGAK